MKRVLRILSNEQGAVEGARKVDVIRPSDGDLLDAYSQAVINAAERYDPRRLI